MLKLYKLKEDHQFAGLNTCVDEQDVFVTDVLHYKLYLPKYFGGKEKNESEPKNYQQISLLAEAFHGLVSEIDKELNVKCFEIFYLNLTVTML